MVIDKTVNIDKTTSSNVNFSFAYYFIDVSLIEIFSTRIINFPKVLTKLVIPIAVQHAGLVMT